MYYQKNFISFVFYVLLSFRGLDCASEQTNLYIRLATSGESSYIFKDNRGVSLSILAVQDNGLSCAVIYDKASGKFSKLALKNVSDGFIVDESFSKSEYQGCALPVPEEFEQCKVFVNYQHHNNMEVVPGKVVNGSRLFYRREPNQTILAVDNDQVIGSWMPLYRGDITYVLQTAESEAHAILTASKLVGLTEKWPVISLALLAPEYLNSDIIYRQALVVLSPFLRATLLQMSSGVVSRYVCRDYAAQLDVRLDEIIRNYYQPSIAGKRDKDARHKQIRESFVRLIFSTVKEFVRDIFDDAVKNSEQGDVVIQQMVGSSSFFGYQESRSAKTASFPAICLDANNDILEITAQKSKEIGVMDTYTVDAINVVPAQNPLTTHRFRLVASSSLLKKSVEALVHHYNRWLSNVYRGETDNVPGIIKITEDVLLRLSEIPDNPDARDRCLMKSTQLRRTSSEEDDDMVVSNPFFSVIIGPPGTGKTTSIAGRLNQYSSTEAREAVRSTLVVSSGYRPLDCVIGRLVNSTQAVLVHSGSYDSRNSSRPECLVHKEFIVRDFNLSAMLSRPLKFATPHNVGVFFGRDNSLETEYDTIPVIVDEASKLTISEFFVVLFHQAKMLDGRASGGTAKSMNQPHFTLVGDDHQLPPFSRTQGIASLSFLELCVNLPGVAPRILDTCFRFGEPALGIIRKVFYNDFPMKSVNPDKHTLVKWHKLAECNATETNNVEAEYILERLQYGDAVISPYNAQVDLIRKFAQQRGVEGVTFSTIDSAQGSQYPRVWVSLVATNRPFVNEPRRLNVAASRMQDELHIVSSSVIPDPDSTTGRLYAAIEAVRNTQQRRVLPANRGRGGKGW